MTAKEYQLKYPNMTKEEAKKLAEIDSKAGLKEMVDWDAMLCESCQ